MLEQEYSIGRFQNFLVLWLPLAILAMSLAFAMGFWASTSAFELNLVPEKPSQMLAFVALLSGATIVFKKPEIGLILLVAVVYSNASEIAVRNHGLPSALQALGILLGLVILVRWMSASSERPRGDAILILLAFYAVVLFGSSLHAINPGLADEKLFEHVKCLVLFALVVNLARSHTTLKRAVWAILIAGAALSTISAYQVLTSSYGWDFGGFGRIKVAQIVGDLRQPRIAGAFADPNFYAQVLIPLVPLALYRFLDTSSRRWKLLGAYCIAACLVALVFTYSRGGILALGVVLGLILIIQKPKLKHCVVGFILILLLLLLVPPQFQQRLGTLSQFMADEESPIVDTDSSFQQRSLLMRVAWDIWRDHPFFGVGAGNYSEYYLEYAEQIGATVDSYENFDQQRFPHSLYLEMAAETGLVGLLLFGAILLTACLKGWHAAHLFRKSGDLKSSRLVMSLLVGIAGYLTTSIFLHAHYLRHLWLLLALLAASSHIAIKAASNRKCGEPS